MLRTHGPLAGSLAFVVVLAAGCARERSTPVSEARDTLAAQAVLRDRPVALVLPLAPSGAGRWTLASVAQARESLIVTPVALSELALEPPEAGPAPPPEAEAGTREPVGLELKPPIPRGAPSLPRGGRGGRVVLDVRVDEDGMVSDVEPVGADADSATVAAAVDAAFASRWYPAMLGLQRVAVWTRQVFAVARGR